MRKATVKNSGPAYHWTQTDDSLTISLPVRNVSRRDVDVLYAELVLKVNVMKQRYVQVIDFPFPIDYANPLNKVQLTDDSLEIFLIKKDNNTGPWTELQLSGLNKTELEERRNRSLEEYYVWQESERKKARELTYEMDHEATRQAMAVDSFQRDKIEKTKQDLH